MSTDPEGSCPTDVPPLQHKRNTEPIDSSLSNSHSNALLFTFKPQPNKSKKV